MYPVRVFPFLLDTQESQHHSGLRTFPKVMLKKRIIYECIFPCVAIGSTCKMVWACSDWLASREGREGWHCQCWRCSHLCCICRLFLQQTELKMDMMIICAEILRFGFYWINYTMVQKLNTFLTNKPTTPCDQTWPKLTVRYVAHPSDWQIVLHQDR